MLACLLACVLDVCVSGVPVWSWFAFPLDGADSVITDEKFAYWTKKDRKSKKRYSQLLAELQVPSCSPLAWQTRFL